MALPHEKLAGSLKELKSIQDTGRRVFRSKELSRTHRERLLAAGFIREVLKGWLMSWAPDSQDGDSTPWYASFWEFCAGYASDRFGSQWHLSPEQSLLLHGQSTLIPTQVVLYTPKGSGNLTSLPFGTSLYDLKTDLAEANDLTLMGDLRVYKPAAALIKVPESFYERFPVEAQVVLSAITDSSDLLTRLLAGGHSAIAGRLAGGLRRIGRPALAEDIRSTMKTAGYDVRETDPFLPQQRILSLQPGQSPVAGRIRALWAAHEQTVRAAAPQSPGLPNRPDRYLEAVEEIYKSDAYHSLSIEGYSVTPQLIERVQSGAWNPDTLEEDRKNKDALAARGYYQAFQKVKSAVALVLQGSDPGKLARSSLRDWYRELFQPMVSAGVLPPTALAGFRTIPVYLRGSRHVPPRWESLPDAMEAVYGLLEAEPHPFVRAVLGHWMVGYIHPFGDGNGRTARFLMNVMLASGGYDWLVIRVEQRASYLAALEAASVNNNLTPFVEFLIQQMTDSASRKL